MSIRDVNISFVLDGKMDLLSFMEKRGIPQEVIKKFEDQKVFIIEL